MRAKIVCALAVLACFGSLVAVAQQGKFKLAEVYRSGKTVTGQELQFPSGKVEIVAATGEFDPGSETPMHKHPYPRSLYIVEGTFTVTEEGGQPRTYPTGSFVVEAVDVWHTGGNASSTPVKILVIDEVPAGVSNLVVKPK
jgi:quercetin dioxygenase-like cupin family protein